MFDLYGQPQDQDSLINYLYPVDLSLEDEEDLETLEAYEAGELD